MYKKNLLTISVALFSGIALYGGDSQRNTTSQNPYILIPVSQKIDFGHDVLWEKEQEKQAFLREFNNKLIDINYAIDTFSPQTLSTIALEINHDLNQLEEDLNVILPEASDRKKYYQKGLKFQRDCLARNLRASDNAQNKN